MTGFPLRQMLINYICFSWVLDHSSAEQEAAEVHEQEEAVEQQAQPEPAEQEQCPQESNVGPETLEMSSEIDLNDLDVPAFLRKRARQEDVNNS